MQLAPQQVRPCCCTFCVPAADMAASQLLEFLNNTTQLMQDSSELVLIIFR
jgi:hypothetical protein